MKLPPYEIYAYASGVAASSISLLADYYGFMHHACAEAVV